MDPKSAAPAPKAPQKDPAPVRGPAVHIGMDRTPLKKRPGPPKTLQRRKK